MYWNVTYKKIVKNAILKKILELYFLLNLADFDIKLKLVHWTIDRYV